ncbi:MAG: riboflavin synthase [Pseudomonadota bacterium]
MFTGIIAAVGTVRAIEPKGGDVRLRIATGRLDLADVKPGDSIATSGVCLTAVALPGDGFVADVSTETLTRSTLAGLKVGAPVNLEKALQPQSRLGGHIVSGHVDGIGAVLRREASARALLFRVRAPQELAKYIAEKGSITVDGISLTVNGVHGAEFDLAIVPHTVQETTVGGWQAGTKVNLEVDVIARHLERLLQGDQAAAAPAGGLTLGLLAENGFLK